MLLLVRQPIFSFEANARRRRCRIKAVPDQCQSQYEGQQLKLDALCLFRSLGIDSLGEPFSDSFPISLYHISMDTQLIRLCIHVIKSVEFCLSYV